jgi:hypothetical protein
LSNSTEKKAALFKNLGFEKGKNGDVHIASSYSDLRTINIITVDKFANTAIGRSIIELDADIVTLLSQDITTTKMIDIIGIHCCSVSLAVQYLKYLMEKISGDLRSLSKAIKIASIVPFGTIIIIIIIAVKSEPSEAILRYLLPIAVSAVTPFLFVPPVIIRALIGRFFKMASV